MQPKTNEQRAIIYLKGYRNKLTRQQYKTIRGQILAGDSEGAMRGLKKVLGKA